MGFDLSHAFEGDSAMARRFLRGLPSGAYYTYVLLRPDGLPFYVGKGRCPLCQGGCPLLYFSSILQVGGIGR
jgi:hypothetical protein